MQMKRIKIKGGDLIRIPLWNDFGFAYAKYIDLASFSDATMVFMIKIYNYWTKTKTFDIKQIEQSGYLIQPFLMAGIVPALKNGLVEIIGNVELTAEDYDIPHFRTYGPIGVNETDAEKWYYVVDSKLSEKIETKYENVKHLETWTSKDIESIQIRVTMQILIKEGLEVSGFFDLKDETFQYEYQKALEIPLLSKIPLELQGKVKK